MKTRLLLLIVVVIGLSSFVVFSIAFHYVQPSKTDKTEADSIYGFAIDDEFGNVTHYPISELDMMPCEDFIAIWDPIFLELNEADMLNEKLTSCRAPLLEVVHANTVCSQYWRVELMEMKQDPKYDFLNDPIYQECSEVLQIKNLCEANGDTWIREKLECVNLEELPPLKQIESGLLLDEVQCKQDLILIQKHDGSVACVSEKTKQKLIERGWIQDDNSMLQKVFDLCNCQKLGGPCINPIFKWQNETHHIDSMSCKWMMR